MGNAMNHRLLLNQLAAGNVRKFNMNDTSEDSTRVEDDDDVTFFGDDDEQTVDSRTGGARPSVSLQDVGKRLSALALGTHDNDDTNNNKVTIVANRSLQPASTTTNTITNSNNNN